MNYYGINLDYDDLSDENEEKIRKSLNHRKFEMTKEQLYDLRDNMKRFWCPNSNYKEAHSNCSSIHTWMTWNDHSVPKSFLESGYPFYSCDNIYVIDSLNDYYLIVRVFGAGSSISNFSTYRDETPWVITENYRRVFNKNFEEIQENNIYCPFLTYNDGWGKYNEAFKRRIYPIIYEDNEIRYRRNPSKEHYGYSVGGNGPVLNQTWIYFRSLPSWCNNKKKIMETLSNFYKKDPKASMSENAFINLFPKASKLSIVNNIYGSEFLYYKIIKHPGGYSKVDLTNLDKDVNTKLLYESLINLRKYKKEILEIKNVNFLIELHRHINCKTYRDCLTYGSYNIKEIIRHKKSPEFYLIPKLIKELKRIRP